MSEWKPGDVAHLSYRFAEGGRAIRVHGCADSNHYVGDHWHFANGSHGDGSGAHTIRPLVVIDTEDTKQVRALGNAWDDLADKHAELTDEPMTLSALRMQHALREFARPTPRIEEPQGLGAVVLDYDGNPWVKVDTAMACDSWTQADSGSRGNDTWVKFAKLYATRILSPGVES